MRALAVLLILAAVALTAGAAFADEPKFVGATLAHPSAPPDFALRDQHGRLVRLSHERGKAVLVTFLYTHCPDVCPLTAANINTALGMLGRSGRDVTVLAVSVDPVGDTAGAVARFVRRHHLRLQFHYLTGSTTALAGVWRAYQVTAVRNRKDAGVDHTLYTLLVDRKGVARVLFDATARPSGIAHDLRILLAR